MNVFVARTLLVRHRQDFNRDRLPWLPGSLYRLLSEVKKVYS
ncbi:hypothetical protein [Roseibium aestuarii]|uniref:Uncharacterized protein n=1 Tax=Roseibium aestuarii TaxID=2600299 RepID=A0ABW4JUJ9_9HYPH|nr:hypothetical protein [Roseibium aestuarii]